MKRPILSKINSRWFLSGATVGVLVFFAFSFLFTKNSENKGAGGKTTGAAQSAFAPKDSDQDCLTDWEESLYRTDPKNRDSDGDGISDGDEIAEGTQPLTPEKISAPDSGGSEQPDDNESVGERFTQDIDTQYSRISALAQGNLSPPLLQDFFGNPQIQTLESKKQDQALLLLLQTIFLPIYEKLPKFNTNAVPDELFTIVETENQESFIRYFNQIELIYEKNLSPLKGEEDQIIGKASAGDANALKKLFRVRTALASAQTKIVQTPVPRPALALHKREVWLTQNAIAQLKLLEEANIEDPIYTILLFDIRGGLRNSLARLHTEEVPQWLTEHQIQFSAKDKAKLLYSNT